jgi:tRNA threonylcarbamoyl adenosine modification protein YeaZ
MIPPGRILVIETASEACSIALLADTGAVIAHDHREQGRGHAESLVPMIAALPDKGHADCILVSLGPGSFTGVRIGLAAARALGVAWGVPVFGYPTLALVFTQAMQITSAIPTVCMNGGHGEWFVADFANTPDAGAVQSLTPEAAAARGAMEVIVGNRAKEFAALLNNGTPAMHLLPDARAVGMLGKRWLTGNLAPIYGRAPDATPQVGWTAP